MTFVQASKIVVVDAKVLGTPKYVAKYMVLRDRTCRDVMRVARNNPGVWIFPFATKSVAECPNYSWLGRQAKHDSRYALVVQPMYIGNLSNVDDAIAQIVDSVLGLDREEVPIETGSNIRNTQTV